MRRTNLATLVGGILLASVTWSPLAAAEPAAQTLHVQLIRGTEEAQPPAKEYKPIGPKLSARLRPIFAWQHYWEVSRKQVNLAPGHKARVKLSPEREVEIDLAEPAKRKVTAFFEGRPVVRTSDAAATRFTVMGGERGDRTAWFIVVRLDQPAVE